MMYKEFIHNLSDGEKSFIDYYDAWCADIIQYPSLRSCICMVLYSLDEGVNSIPGIYPVTKKIESPSEIKSEKLKYDNNINNDNEQKVDVYQSL